MPVQDAGARFIYWYAGGMAGTFVPPPRPVLQLSDFNPVGKGMVEILGIVEVDKTTNTWWDEAGGVGMITDAASDFQLDMTGQDTLMDTFTVNTAITDFNLIRLSGAGWNASFEGTGHLIEGRVYLQTTAGEVEFLVNGDLQDAGFSFARFTVDAARRPILRLLQTGDRMIIAVTGPPLTHSLRWPGDTLVNWPMDQIIAWPGL